MKSTISTTKMSSKGQVVIPEQVRESLGLESGTQFVVMSDKENIILHRITPPPEDNFKELLATARKEAKKYNLTEKDVAKAIKEARKK